MRLALCSVAALVAGCVLAASAAATIVVGKGIGGIRLGMTEAMVRGTIGDPASRQRGTNDFGPYTIITYRQPPIRITFQGNAGATAIVTTNPGERTAAGIGVGSTEAAVKAKVRNVKCMNEGASFRHCFVGKFLPGRIVTDFWVKQGKVTRVVVGLVID